MISFEIANFGRYEIANPRPEEEVLRKEGDAE